MEQAMTSCKDSSWWAVTLPAVVGADTLLSTATAAAATFLLPLLLALLSLTLLTYFLSPAGPAWPNHRARRGHLPIPGARGLPLLGSLLSLTRSLPHRSLARLAKDHNATDLLAFSIGATPAVVASAPSLAREILSHPGFADRPLKQSARELMFARAIGFAPNGAYWRQLRRIASAHLFSPRRVAAHEPGRQSDCLAMLRSIAHEQHSTGRVHLRPHLQGAALNNIMGSVFGRRYDVSVAGGDAEAAELQALVREGFDLLGAFNWSDHLPWLAALYDPNNVKDRCAALVPRVRHLVKGILADHRSAGARPGDAADFVDVLLSLDGDERLDEDDMVAVLWEMIFRGTDTTALLTEWAMAELVLHPRVQRRLAAEIDGVVGPGGGVPTDADVSRMPYLQAVVKETLRAHPPGPLLSWARLSTADVRLSNGMVVPRGTTAMVNMWAITHDAGLWARPDEFKPERFLAADGGVDIDVRGGDLRLAPFGAGRRVCPGKNLGIATVGLWVARLVQQFRWEPKDGTSPAVDLSELLKLSLEMKTPLTAVVVPREEGGAGVV